MDDVLQPKKSQLIFKSTLKKMIKHNEPQTKIQQKLEQLNEGFDSNNDVNKGSLDELIQKTAAEKSFEIVKKKRMISKNTKKMEISNKKRLQIRNKILSKLPYHFDLARTGEKIQKGY